MKTCRHALGDGASLVCAECGTPIKAIAARSRYFHGGVRGFNRGDELVPPNEHGGDWLAEAIAYLDAMAIGDQQKAARAMLASGQFVFITPVRKHARVFAAAQPAGGALYQVEPIGPLVEDPDAPGNSFGVARARIVAVYDAFVPFDVEQIHKLIATGDNRRKWAISGR